MNSISYLTQYLLSQSVFPNLSLHCWGLVFHQDFPFQTLLDFVTVEMLYLTMRLQENLVAKYLCICKSCTAINYKLFSSACCCKSCYLCFPFLNATYVLFSCLMTAFFLAQFRSSTPIPFKNLFHFYKLLFNLLCVSASNLVIDFSTTS